MSGRRRDAGGSGAARHHRSQALKRSIDRIPSAEAEAEEVAAVAVFAASPRASYLTGVYHNGRRKFPVRGMKTQQETHG